MMRSNMPKQMQGKMKGKMMREGKEKYANKAMMKQHERAETPAKERMEGMKKGGKVRGSGCCKRTKQCKMY